MVCVVQIKLRGDWILGGPALSRLNSQEQRVLHATYQHSKEEISDEHALAAYRHFEHDKQDHMLALEDAGAHFVHAYEKLQDDTEVAKQPADSGTPRKRRAEKDRHLKSHSLVRPEIDVEALARLIAQMALSNPSEEQDESGHLFPQNGINSLIPEQESRADLPKPQRCGNTQFSKKRTVPASLELNRMEALLALTQDHFMPQFS